MLDGEICKDGVGVVSRQDLFHAAATAIGATNNISKADDPLRVWPLNLAKFSRPSSSSSLGKLQRLLPQLTRCCCRCQCNARVCNIKLKQGWLADFEAANDPIRYRISFSSCCPDAKHVKSPYRARRAAAYQTPSSIHPYPDPSISSKRGSTSCGAWPFVCT